MSNPHSPKIWGIGLSRTGTTSLNEALRILGYKAGHFVLPKHFDRFEAVTDTPAAARYLELDKRYPGSKFILTVRDDLEDWLGSCERYFGKKELLQKNEEIVAEGLFVRQALYGTAEFDRGLWEQAYRRHVGAVMRHFQGRDQHLLVLNICTGDGWEKLCPFLGRPVPQGVRFPHSNAAS
jgi:hypothetical protein